jgi:hypothetical protein
MNASMYEPQVNSFYLIDPADKMNGSMYFFWSIFQPKWMRLCMNHKLIIFIWLILQTIRMHLWPRTACEHGFWRRVQRRIPLQPDQFLLWNGNRGPVLRFNTLIFL